MRIDPLDVISNALANPPLRLAFAWLCAIAGAFFPLFILKGFGAFGYLGWQWLLFPVYLLYMAVDGGWWTIIALPLLALLGWRMIAFMCNENTGSDLFAIFTISYLICIQATGTHWPLGLILAVYLIYQTIYLDRRERREDPYNSIPQPNDYRHYRPTKAEEVRLQASDSTSPESQQTKESEQD